MCVCAATGTVERTWREDAETADGAENDQAWENEQDSGKQ